MASEPEELRAAARRHVEDTVVPGIGGWEQEGRFPRETVREAGRSGLCGLFAPAEVGGRGLSYADGMPVFEELGRGDASYAFALS